MIQDTVYYGAQSPLDYIWMGTRQSVIPNASLCVYCLKTTGNSL